MAVGRPKSRTVLVVLAAVSVCVVCVVAFSQDLASPRLIRRLLPALSNLAFPKGRKAANDTRGTVEAGKAPVQAAQTQVCAPAFDRPVSYLPLPASPNCTRTFVRSARQVLHNEYPAWHAAQATNASVSVLVFQYKLRGVPRAERNRGGLGDVFKFMALAYEVAVASGRLFFIHWEGDLGLEEMLVPQGAVDWRWKRVAGIHGHRPSVTVDKIIDRAKGVTATVGTAASLRGGKAFRLRYDAPNKTWRLPSSGAPADVVWWDIRLGVAMNLLMDNPHLPGLDGVRAAADAACGRWPKRNYDAELPDVLRVLFRPSPRMRDALRAEMMAIGLPPGTCYVGVHGRVGVGVGENLINKRAWKPPLSSVASGLLDCVAGAANATMDMPRGQHATTPCRPKFSTSWSAAAAASVTTLFVAADTPSFSQDVAVAARRRGWKVVVSRQLPVHTGSLMDGTSPASTEDLQAAMWSSMLDIFILGGGQALIGIRSGFNALAFSVGGSRSFVDMEASAVTIV